MGERRTPFTVAWVGWCTHPLALTIQTKKKSSSRQLLPSSRSCCIPNRIASHHIAPRRIDSHHITSHTVCGAAHWSPGSWAPAATSGGSTSCESASSMRPQPGLHPDGQRGLYRVARTHNIATNARVSTTQPTHTTPTTAHLCCLSQCRHPRDHTQRSQHQIQWPAPGVPSTA